MMARERISISLALFAFQLSQASAQDQVDICYGPEGVVVAVIVTFLVTLALLAAGLFMYKTYWKSRQGKHLMLVTDAENPNDQYAFDNPCFREATPIKRNIQDEKQTSKLEKNKWLGWNPLNFGMNQKPEKITSLDDSYMNDSRLKVVTLKSHDFTGLGFNICGNMRDGIFVKDVLHRGPAFESGCINSGDRIDSVCISFRNMVFEDALTILSYASPYDVQVQVENDAYSRPSTLIRSKRESNAVSSAEIIRHPKYSRSQSISHLNEIGKSNNKRISHQIGFMLEKNRINQSLNKNLEGSNDYPTIKLSAPGHEPKRERQKFEKNATSKISPLPRDKKSSDSNSQSALESSGDHQSKLQKFGIKVLPMSINPKLGDVGGKKLKDQPRPAMLLENEINPQKEKSEKPEKPKQANESSRSTSPLDDSLKTKPTGTDELDNGKENVKAILTKGFQNLKEKINQNTLGKKKSKDSTTIQSAVVEEESGAKKAEPKNERVISTKESPKDKNAPTGIPEGECPVPKRRSSVTSGPKVYEKNKQNISVPEEVSRAGDVARNSRKSINDPNSSRKSGTSLNSEAEVENQLNLDLKDKIKEKKVENYSDSDHSIDGDSLKTSDEAKRPKRSKGKAPAPPGPDLPKDDRPSASPKQIFTSEINEITKDVEVKRNKKPNDLESETSETKIIELKKENKKEEDRHHLPSYDSDSDTESRNVSSKDRPNNTKIELNATQVTVHQSSSGDGNDDDVEPSRKAASLGDLSKLDSDQPLSIVLERAVSLDLADGSSQGSKKRKAPLPPSEEFPAAFDDLNYRKEPRLEHGLGLNTFQRRLKKSSDFGTLEDALSDGPKSLEIEVNKRSSPIDLTEAHNTNIQEFSSWLAECRRPKSSYSETSGEETAASRISSTSLVNINASEDFDKEDENDNRPQYEYQGSNVSFSVNGKNFPDFDKVSEEERAPNFPGVNSRTVVVISQPSSLEPTIVETVPINYSKDEKSQNTLSKDSEDYDIYSSALSEECTSLDPYVTSSESRLESFHKEAKPDDYDSPPKLPSSPMPVMTTSSTLSSPLSSSLTYITEIKVSTAQKEGNKESMTTEPPKSTKPSGNGPTDRYELDSGELITSTPRPETVNSISKRIQQFDTKQSLPKPFISPIRTKPGFGYVDGKSVNSPSRKENNMIFEPSKIPIKTMKSETGQKVLATIQSLATKEASPPKIPEMEYAKRMASLFSGNSLERNQVNLRRQLSTSESTETGQPNISGFYLKGPEMSPTKSSKDFYPGRKIPPTVPPRKMETSLSSTSSVKVELTGNNHESPLTSSQAGMSGKLSPVNTQERNIVTFSSFMPKKPSEESTNSTLISFKIK